MDALFGPERSLRLSDAVHRANRASVKFPNFSLARNTDENPRSVESALVGRCDARGPCPAQTLPNGRAQLLLACFFRREEPSFRAEGDAVSEVSGRASFHVFSML